MRRRRFIAALRAVGAVAVAGCSSTDDGDQNDDVDDTGTNTLSPTDDGIDTGTADDSEGDPGSGETTSGATSGPQEPVAGFLRAEEENTTVEYLHPAHPLHPTNGWSCSGAVCCDGRRNLGLDLQRNCRSGV